MRTTVVISAMVIGAIALGSVAVAQAVVPVEQEPQHHLALDNTYVRVLDVALPAGYVSLFHLHSRDNVAVRIATDMQRTDLIGAEGDPAVTPVGRVSFNSASPPYTHRVANVGTTTIRIVDVELLTSGIAPMTQVPDDLSNHTIALDNERVRGARIQLAAGQSLPAHTHPRGWLEIVVTGQDPGHFAWHVAGSTVPAVIGGPTPIEIVEIEPK